MKVEYTEAERKPKKKKRKKSSKIKAIIVAILTLILVLSVAVVLTMTVFFNVSSIKVVGSSIYTSEEIIYASGIINGDNLFRLPKTDIEARIEKALPYIKKAEIIKSYPESIGISVEPAEEKYLLSIESKSFVADADYKLLKMVDTENNDYIKIVGIFANDVEVGKSIEFSDNQQKDIINDLFSICNEKGLNLSYIDVTSLVDISFVINKKQFIQIGSYTDLGGKMNHLMEVMKTVQTDEMAVISLKDWSLDNKEAVLKYTNLGEYIT